MARATQGAVALLGVLTLSGCASTQARSQPSPATSTVHSTERCQLITTPSAQPLPSGVVSGPLVDPNIFGRVDPGSVRHTDDVKAAVAQAMAGVDRDVVRSACVAFPGGTVGRDGQFNASVAVPGADAGGSIRGSWEAALVEGSVADLLNVTSVPDLFQVISHASVTGVLPDGSKTEVPTGVGDVAADQTFAEAALPDDEIMRRAREAVTGTGVTVVSMRVLHPLGPALELTVSASPELARSGRLGELFRKIQGNAAPANLDGLYFEVDLPDGRPAAIAAGADRNGQGSNWADPVLGEYLAPHG